MCDIISFNAFHFVIGKLMIMFHSWDFFNRSYTIVPFRLFLAKNMIEKHDRTNGAYKCCAIIKFEVECLLSVLFLFDSRSKIVYEFSDKVNCSNLSDAQFQYVKQLRCMYVCTLVNRYGGLKLGQLLASKFTSRCFRFLVQFRDSFAFLFPLFIRLCHGNFVH